MGCMMVKTKQNNLIFYFFKHQWEFITLKQAWIIKTSWQCRIENNKCLN